MLLSEIFKALSGNSAKQKIKKKTQAQIDKEKHEKERKLWEMAEEYEEEE